MITKKKIRSPDILFNILLNNKGNVDYTIDKLKTYYIKHINIDKFDKYKNNFVSFDQKKQGFSGSVVGYLSNDQNTVIKFHNFQFTDIEKFINNTDNVCLKIDNKINEIIMNIILKNIKYIPKITDVEVKKINKHILPITDYGFSEKGVFITMPKVGFMIDNQFITNLGELLKYNHLKIIKNIEKENVKEIIDLYNDFLITMFNQYFSVIQILQKRINFIIQMLN
jgi:hypothetical protein